MNMRPVVLRGRADARPKPHRNCIDGRIGHHDPPDFLLQAIHDWKGNVLPGFRRSIKNAGVLLRKESFGNDDEQIAGGDHCADEGEQRGEAVAQHEIDAALVAVGERNEAFLAEVIEPAVPLLVVALEKARRHHGRKRQRDEGRDEDRHRDRD